MDVACVTTPFGRRSMSLALLARHRQIDQINPEMKRNKWKLFRAICEARGELGVSDRSLSVLDALLSFYPSEDLAASGRLIVFPSNAQLSVRARGMTATTLRRHLAALVDAGLILRKDSPNGKRYARRSRAGDINEAFGFSLAPLLARAQEIEHLAGKISADRELIHATKERISLCRRDISKLIQSAQDGQIEGEWHALYDRFRSFLSSLPRHPSLDELQTLLSHLTQLRARIINLLEDHQKAQNMGANESQNGWHIQDSQTQSFYESERKLQIEKTTVSPSPEHLGNTAIQSELSQEQIKNREPTLPNVPLDMVLRACPEILPYGPKGSIKTWRDLVCATTVPRSMMQISMSAFHDACLIMGPENASVAIACIFEKGGSINSAGAYLRDLTRRATKQQFTVRPMLAALLKSRSCMHKKALA